MLRSPSPSNAILSAALFLRTVLDSFCRFAGVGSEPRPGNFPSTCSLIRYALHPSSLHKFGAATACAPFPKSRTTLNFFDLIFDESTWDLIPERYVWITLGSVPVLPGFVNFGH